MYAAGAKESVVERLVVSVVCRSVMLLKLWNSLWHLFVAQFVSNLLRLEMPGQGWDSLNALCQGWPRRSECHSARPAFSASTHRK